MKKGSYRDILKSTTVVGGAQVIKVILGIVKNKILSILIGPAGIGLIGAYNSAIGMVASISGLGVGFSGVREIAKADASGDEQLISKTVFTFRRITVFLGILGVLICLIFSKPLSIITFGNPSHTKDFSFLSIVIFLTIILSSQNALIQGKRRIKDLAKLNVYGTLYSILISVPLIYIWGLKGIVPFLILLAFVNTLISWWYAKKIKIKRVYLSLREVIINSKSFIHLGIAFMSGGFLHMVNNYLIRVFIIRTIDIEALGFYQASYIMSTVYIGVILNAMGKDYYPRLTAVSNNSEKCARLINEQTEIGILIATPGLLLTLVFAPIIVKLLYSAKFMVAVEILRWQILGVFLQVISFSIGYLTIAKGLGKLFFYLQLAFCLIHLLLIWLFVNSIGIVGTGIAFFLLYVLHVIILYIVGKKLINFHWSKEVKNLILLTSVIIAITFISLVFFKNYYGLLIGIIITIGMIYYSFRKMMKVMEVRNFSDVLQLIKRKVKADK